MSWPRPIEFIEPEFIVGVDIGQLQDPSGLVVLERIQPRGVDHAIYAVRGIERLPLRASYPAQVSHIRNVMVALADHAPRPKRVTLVIDATGVGTAISDLVREAGFEEFGCGLGFITITSGHAPTRGDGPGSWHVPKKDLVATTLVALQNKRLHIAEGLPMASELRTELLGFRARITLSGHTKFEAGETWRTAPHDDLVLATAIGLWWGEHAYAGGWTTEQHAGFGAWLADMGVGGIT
jgi:hypothetical protein